MAAKLIELHPRLFIRGHTRHLDSIDVLNLLRKHDVKTVINVALIPDNYLSGATRTIGIDYKHVPLRDSKLVHPDPALVNNLAREVRMAMEKGGVVVHCDSGWNRSALVAIRALTLYTQEDPAVLIAAARAVRPKVLKNPAFEKFVLSYGVSWS